MGGDHPPLTEPKSNLSLLRFTAVVDEMCDRMDQGVIRLERMIPVFVVSAAVMVVSLLGHGLLFYMTYGDYFEAISQ